MTTIATLRLRLQPWREDHRAAFAQLHADPEVMADLGGPIARSESDAKFDRYVAAYEEHGISRWAVEDTEGRFLGYAGIMPRPDVEHPLGPHHEIGWRMAKNAWGQGYATESAGAALEHAPRRLGAAEIVSYTSAENQRSHAVMKRLGLTRTPSRDFTAEYNGIGLWRRLVWVAPRPDHN